jgi:hypothetical protein
MIDLSSRDALPKDADGKVLITLPSDDEASAPALLLMNPMSHATENAPESDYAKLLNFWRTDWYELCRFFIDPELLEHGHYGDDCGDYRNAAAYVKYLMQDAWGQAMWHSEIDQYAVDELNLWLNCADEDHCIHQFSLDGPDLGLERLAPLWEDCPLMQAPEGN